MTLNKWHRDIIEHRPVDCIVGSAFDLTDDSPGNDLSQTMSEGEAFDYVDSLKGEWEVAESIDIAGLNPIQQYVLWDIIDGSTSAACLANCGDKAEYKATCKAGRELAREFSKYHGEVEFPVL